MKHSAKINHIEWSEYPIGTRANSISGGYWEKTEFGWKWCTGATFPQPGGDVSSIILPKGSKHYDDTYAEEDKPAVESIHGVEPKGE